MTNSIQTRRWWLLAMALCAAALVVYSFAQRLDTAMSATPSEDTVSDFAVLREPAQPSKTKAAVDVARQATSVRSVSDADARPLNDGMSIVPAVVIAASGGDAKGLCLVRGTTIGCKPSTDGRDLFFAEVASDGANDVTHVSGLAPDGVAEAVFDPIEGPEVRASVTRNSYELTVQTPRSGEPGADPDGRPIPAPSMPARGTIILKSDDGTTVARLPAGA